MELYLHIIGGLMAVSIVLTFFTGIEEVQEGETVSGVVYITISVLIIAMSLLYRPLNRLDKAIDKIENCKEISDEH